MSDTPEPSVPRRRFLKTVGIAGLSTALAPAALALAQSAPPPAAARPDSTKAPAAPAAPAPPGEDAKALAAIIERRYGKHLTKEQLESIAKDFEGDLRATERLRAVKLQNADEPDVTFRVKDGLHA